MPKRIFSLLIGALLFAAPAAVAQTSTVPSQPRQDRLRVSLACSGCDRDYLRTSIPFLEFVDDGAEADARVALTASVAGADQRWTLTVTGYRQFEDQNRTVEFVVPVSAPDGGRADVARFLRLALAEYAATSPLGPQLDVTFRRPGPTASAPQAQHDPWHYWFFRLNANAFGSGQQTTSGRSYSFSGSANRVTEGWKLRFQASRGVDQSSFEISSTQTVTSRLTSWGTDALIVKSLGPKWSLGLTSAVTGSTFSNTKRLARVMPGVEYDIFPYSESSRRSLTFQYSVGVARYLYHEETIFERVRETVAQHAFISSLGLRQPWGQAGASLTFTQQLSEPARTRTTLNGNINVRLLRSLTLTTSARYSRIRDLFTLPRGTATDEDILLRQRQLATGYQYSLSVGLSYSFGALANTTVNPRFGG